MEIMNNVQKQMGNAGRELKTLWKKSKEDTKKNKTKQKML